MSAVLEFDGVSKAYDGYASGARVALRDVSFAVSPGDAVAIIGRSGSGKSTLLHLAAGIDVPTAGVVRWSGVDLGGLSDRERTKRRRDRVGLIFQFFHLLSHLSVLENVALPELIAGRSPRVFEDSARALLEKVGLADRAADRVDRLSGGEMQRVAICRALVRRPPLILADEPTGNLDDPTALAVMELLLALVREQQGALVYVTHSGELAALGDRRWELHSGVLTAA